MTPSILITGASGYVGRHVAREFSRQGYKVTGLVRSDRAAQFLMEFGAFPVHGDLGSPETYKAAAANADVIVHAGFSYTEEGEERADIDRRAVDALLNFAAGDGRSRSFIYTGSVFRYGPGAEEFATELNAVPRDPADWRHAVGEQVLAASTSSLKTAVIRLGWVFGSDGGTLGQAIASLAGKPIPEGIASNRVPLVDVFDLARLYVDAARGEGGVFHGCGGRPITVGELAAVATAVKLDPQPADQGAEEHFASIFQSDTPAISIHQPVVGDLAARLAASLRTEEE